MRLSGEIDDNIGFDFREEFFNAILVANVKFFETEVRIFKSVF